MKKILIFSAFSALFFFLSVKAGLFAEKFFVPRESGERAGRVVSLAPNITESLFAIGLDKEIVGVTRYCDYPPQALEKTEVAGFRDINFEAVLRARPDVVFIPRDREDDIEILRSLGLKTLPLDTLTLSGLERSLEVMGRATGREEEAGRLLKTFQEEKEKARQAAKGLKYSPGVLFVVMRAYEGERDIDEISAVGRDKFYDELIKLAGGNNVYEGNLAYPTLSKEAVLYLSPDVIVDVIAPGRDLDTAEANWADLKNLPAFKKGAYFITDRQEATVPGPRFPYILGRLSEMIIRAGESAEN